MAKKSVFQEATDAVRSVAGAALGAAAVAATGVVVKSVASAIRDSGQSLEDSAPQIQNLAGSTVSKPVLPRRSKKVASKSKTKKSLFLKKRPKKAAKRVARKRR